MNLQQTLEKLAVVAGDWVQIDRDKDGDVTGIYIQRKGTMRKCLRIGGIDEDRVFGAICEKCEAEGWDWASHKFTDTPDGQAEYYFGINPMGSIEDGGLGCGVSTEHLAHAAAQALLAALEAKGKEVSI